MTVTLEHAPALTDTDPFTPAAADLLHRAQLLAACFTHATTGVVHVLIAAPAMPGPAAAAVRGVLGNALSAYGRVREEQAAGLDLPALDADLEHALASAQAFGLVRTGSVVDDTDILLALIGGTGHGAGSTVRGMLGEKREQLIAALEDVQRGIR